jgi:NADH dehydrogenase
VRATSAHEKIARLKELGATTITGNLRDTASLDMACEGVSTVISTVSMVGTAQPGDSFQDTDAAGTIALIEAAKAAGAQHFIFVSFDATRFPDTPLTDAKKTVEAHLREGGIDYTILQPPPFMESWLGPMLFGDPSTGQVKIFGQGEGRVPYISYADVAEIVVRAVHLPSARDATITFGGPEAISQRDAVRMFEEAMGKPLTVTAVPQEALEAQWQTAENPFEKTFAGLMLGIARLDEETRAPGEGYEFQMATVRDFAKKSTGSQSYPVIG